MDAIFARHMYALECDVDSDPRERPDSLQRRRRTVTRTRFKSALEGRGRRPSRAKARIFGGFLRHG